MSKLKFLTDLASSLVSTKRLVTAGAVGLAIYMFGGPAYSYISTAARLVTTNVYERLPVEFEIERAKTMIDDLIPEIKENMINIAKEEVSVRNLNEEVTRDELILEKRKSEIQDFTEVIRTSGKDAKYVVVGTRKVNREVAEQQLRNAFQRLKWDLDTFQQRQEMLANQMAGLDSAKRALEQKLDTKRDLEVEVENLLARMQSLQHETSGSTVSFDESKFSRCRDLVNSLRARLDVTEQMVANGNPIEYIPVSNFAPKRDIINEIDDFFAQTGEIKDQEDVQETEFASVE